MKHTAAINIRGVSRTIKDAFKSECAKRGLTMEYAVQELIRQFITNPTIIPPPKLRFKND